VKNTEPSLEVPLRDVENGVVDKNVELTTVFPFILRERA
jgi:hypothetical protein